MQNYQKLESIFKKISTLGNISSMLGWDHSVIMPRGSGDARVEQFMLLQSLSYELLSNPKVPELLDKAQNEGLDDWQKANLTLMKRQIDHMIAVPEDLLNEFSKATNACEMYWRDAKKNNDFKSFAPYLQEVVKLVREVADHKAEKFNCDPYDALIDSYDPGTKSAELDILFEDLSSFLPSFLQKVQEHQLSAQPKILDKTLNLSTASQNKIAQTTMKALGFDFARGRLDISEHPFCGGISDDTRITTKYNEDNLINSLMGVVHETGHAIYQQNLPKKWQGQPVGDAHGMALHESQSLLFEMQIGMSREFLSFLQPIIVAEKEGNHHELEIDNLYKIMNIVKPSFIRIEADEVTYPLHVILRYKLEKAILKGDLQVADLPGAWDDMMSQMLGIRPSNYQEGCMQDIHWPWGSFGYFPSYTLGALIAAQLFAAIKQQVPNVLNSITKGEFTPVTSWLKANIHQYGSKHSVNELLLRATGKTLDASYFKNYLESKYLG